MNKLAAIVTGAASGQGAATSVALAASGHPVVCFDVNNSTEIVSRIHAGGGTAVAIEADVRDRDSWAEAVAIAESTFGGVHILANVAGIAPIHESILDCNEAAWQRTLDINLKGPWLGMAAVMPGMLKRGEGRIVNVASLAATLGVNGLSSYSASKGGLVALTRQAAVDYSPLGIRINAINPGVIDTPMNYQNDPEMTAAFLEKTPVPRQGTAEEIAAAIVFLVSPGADFITGQVLAVDGGWSIRS